MENFPYFEVRPALMALAEEAERDAGVQFRRIEENQRWNQQKMLAAFQQSR